MEKGSRLQYAVKNVGIAGVMQIITILLNFVSRAIFVRILGNDYLSCDGLFSNILTVLSFTELGIGSAIVFSLYSPIAANDRVQIGKLMNLFATAYRYIALVITILGLSIIPFLKYLITDVPEIQESITFLYMLFLANTVASYIWRYKSSYLMANQENYIVVLVHQIVHIVKIIVQFVLLLCTHNYILYLVINIVCTIANNIICTSIVDKKYSWLKEYQNNKLSKEDLKPIFSNISAIFQYKLGSVILNGTSNIIISIVLKTALVGLTSNYTMVINATQGIVNRACDGLKATVGNYNAISDSVGRYKIFRKLYFISNWVIGFLTICLAVLLNPLIGDVWLGKEYVLSYDVVIAMCLSMFITQINIIPSTYRMTMGYFREAKMCPIYASVLNVVLSVVLGKSIGLSGIFLAAALSRLFTFIVIDSYYIFKKGFNCSVAKFYVLFIPNLIVLVINYVLTAFCVNLISLPGILGFVIKAVLAVIVSNLVFIIAYVKTNDFHDVLTILKKFIKKKTHNANEVDF